MMIALAPTTTKPATAPALGGLMRLGPRPAQVFSRSQGGWRVPISAMLAREAVC